MERWLAKTDSVDKPNYAKGKAEGRLEHELLSNVRANVCEWAVAKHYNISWSVPWYPNALHPQRKAIADVGKNGEVRSMRTRDVISVWEKDRGKFIFGAKVIDIENYTKVELYPYFLADKYMEDKYFNNNYNCWQIPISELTAPTV